MFYIFYSFVTIPRRTKHVPRGADRRTKQSAEAAPRLGKSPIIPVPLAAELNVHVLPFLGEELHNVVLSILHYVLTLHKHGIWSGESCLVTQ